ncbi:MAG: hypothetical protein ACI30S_05010 [Muribaculaceae bacterium]
MASKAEGRNESTENTGQNRLGWIEHSHRSDNDTKDSEQRKPEKKSNGLVVGLLIVVVLLLLGVIYLLLPSGQGNEVKNTEEEDKTVCDSTIMPNDILAEDTVDTVEVIEDIVDSFVPKPEPKPEPKTEPKKDSVKQGNISLSYGNYKGGVKDGYPHGQGTLYYTSSRMINKYDPKGRIANAGDYIVGEFHNGFVVHGKHYDSEGNLIGSLFFGVADDAYESK